MKETFLIVGIIAAGILVIALLLNNSPDLMSYDPDAYTYQEETRQDIPDLQLSIVTTEAKFWDKVHALNPQTTTMSSKNTSVNLTDENGNQILSVTGADDNQEETENTDKNKVKDTPVTTVPD